LGKEKIVNGKESKEGFISDLLYNDQVFICLKERLRLKSLPTISCRQYSWVRNHIVGIRTAEELIVIIRLSGTFGAKSENFKIFKNEFRRFIQSNTFNALIIRINCVGGDFKEAHLMWKEICCLGSNVPIAASLSNVSTCTWYYVAMRVGVIVDENLTLTGCIGVALRKEFNQFYHQNTNRKIQLT